MPQPQITAATAPTATGRAPRRAPRWSSASTPIPQSARDHERQPLVDEAVEDVPRIAVQEDETGGCKRPGHDSSDERAGGEVPLEIGSVGTPRVADEEYRREVGAGGHEERPDHERERVEPAGHRVARRVADRDAASGDRADHRSQEEGREHRRQPEERRRQGTAAGRDARCVGTRIRLRAARPRVQRG